MKKLWKRFKLWLARYIFRDELDEIITPKMLYADYDVCFNDLRKITQGELRFQVESALVKQLIQELRYSGKIRYRSVDEVESSCRRYRAYIYVKSPGDMRGLQL